ncbi:MAG: alkaline phosphatase family protein [Pseudomonadota bacterium]
MEIENRTDETVWIGLYNLDDTAYSATLFPWGARKKLEKKSRLTVHPNRAKVQVVFWTSGAFGRMYAKPKSFFTTGATICSDKHGYYVYNRIGEPTAKDKIDHIVVLMLENRSFDNLMGWLYDDKNNIPPRNIPSPTSGEPRFDGLVENKYWNTLVAGEHDTAPESERVYATKGSSDTKPDPNPREVCPSFVEQMFGTDSPDADQKPNMWGFMQNYSGLKDNKDVDGIMSCFKPDQVPNMSKLATDFAVSDRWFGPLPSETWPSRSFLHAGTSFGMLNNCDQKETENCVPNFFVYAGKRTIFDVLAEQDIRWAVYQDAAVVGTLLSAQFWTIHQKLKWHAYHLGDLKHQLAQTRAPQYIFIEPSYVPPFANDQHPPHSVAEGDKLIAKVYKILKDSGLWHKTMLIVTYDEHGGCYDHSPPPTALPPDDSKAQFKVGEINPFAQYGPRVPAIVASPYVEPGTVFRGEPGREYDHTSILATIRDWVFSGKPDILGDNPRIKNAPTVWPVLTRTVAGDEEVALTEPVSDSAGSERESSEQFSYRQKIIRAMSEAERIVAVECDGDIERGADPQKNERYFQLILEKMAELEWDQGDD